MRTPFAILAALLGAVALTSCNSAKTVDDAALKAADSDSANWLMYGRTYDDHRYSPLKEITEENVGKLGLAWSKELGSNRGLEATPLEKDGILYTTGNWSVVYALDAKTGEQKWMYDPRVDRTKAFFNCCDVVNRGAALYKGKVYVATLDAHLIALDEKTGKPVWNIDTAENGLPYSITSAPRIAKGMVVIGNAGSEYGVRGYVSAYDAETGKLAWRSYTVPGDPSKKFESKAMEEASKTWSDGYWKTGGGGTPWEGVVYDPDLDLLYFGTGNPTAWYRQLRGKGDALYTSSIVAVKAGTGEIVWHYQTTPSDNWDFDATQPLIQAELTIGGKARKVIMQANKNGFFYVLDRATGEFISGTAFADGITWASGIDPKGRPIENAGVAQHDEIISPSPDGAHNWNPISFSPSTGFVYFAGKSRTEMLHTPNAKWQYDRNNLNLGIDPMYNGPLGAKLPTMAPPEGRLVAWDPVNRKEAWSAKYPTAEGGGVLTTGGNLVFQGRADGIVAAYRASDGKQLWSFDAGTGVIAPPMTYSVDGTQYISLMVGWGGAPGSFNAPGSGPVKPGFGRVLTFKVGGTAAIKALPFGHKEPPKPTLTTKATPQVIKEGGMLFGTYCTPCHGVNAVSGINPDLRYSSAETIEHLDDILLHGDKAVVGMPAFDKILNASQTKSIQAYIIARAVESAKQ